MTTLAVAVAALVFCALVALAVGSVLFRRTGPSRGWWRW